MEFEKRGLAWPNLVGWLTVRLWGGRGGVKGYLGNLSLLSAACWSPISLMPPLFVNNESPSVIFLPARVTPASQHIRYSRYTHTSQILDMITSWHGVQIENSLVFAFAGYFAPW